MLGDLRIQGKQEDRPNVLQVPFVDFEVDWRAAQSAIWPREGIVYVEAAPFEEKKNGIYLPDELQRRSRADLGIVLAVGPDRKEPFLTGSGYEEAPLPLDVHPGELVLCDAYRGDSFEVFKIGSYEAKGIVRVYGDASCDHRRFRGRQIDEFIPAVMTKSKILPRGRFVLARRDPVRQKAGDVYLMDREQTRPPFCQVIACSPQAEERGIKEGARYQYKQIASHPLKMYELELGPDVMQRYGLDGDLDDYALIPHQNLLAEV